MKIFVFFNKHIGTRGKEILAWSLFVIISMSLDLQTNLLEWWILFLPYILLAITLISLFYPRATGKKAEPFLIDLMRQPDNRAKWIILFLFLSLGLLTITFEYVYYNAVISNFSISAWSSLAVLLLIEQFNRPRQIKSVS